MAAAPSAAPEAAERLRSLLHQPKRVQRRKSAAVDNLINAFVSHLNQEHAHWREIEREGNIKAVREAIEKEDKATRQRRKQAMQSRILRRYGAAITLKLVLHLSGPGPGGEAEEYRMLQVSDNIRLGDLVELTRQRFSFRKKTQVLRLVWLTGQGSSSIAIDSQRLLHEWLDESWCRHPVILHVIDETNAASASLDLSDSAALLFDEFDIDRDGFIDESELRALLNGMNLAQQLQVTEDMVDQFIAAEFKLADKDGSGSLDFDEFCAYYNRMSDWARTQLVEHNQHVHIYKMISEYCLESRMSPSPLKLSEVSTYQGEGGTLRSAKYDVSLQVWPGATPGVEAPLWSICTLLPHRVSHISKPDDREDGEYLFTPIVQLECNYQGRFSADVELSIPHCFSTRDGSSALVVLGCETGLSQWERIDSSQVVLSDDELRVRVPYAGIFCGFSNAELGSVALVRLYVVLSPKVAPFKPSSLRVHLCPFLPDQAEEVVLEEQCEWGLVSIAGRSKTLRLSKGQAMSLELQGQTETITWMGSRCHVCMMYDPTDKVVDGNDGEQFRFEDSILVTLVPGVGKRAALAGAMAVNAGLSREGYNLRFKVATHEFTPPSPPTEVRLVSRNARQFTLEWRPPTVSGGCHVSRYAIEVSQTNSRGVVRPFKQVWQGLQPSFLTTINESVLEGRARMRCWNLGTPNPSEYSEVLELQRVTERAAAAEEGVEEGGGGAPTRTSFAEGTLARASRVSRSLQSGQGSRASRGGLSVSASLPALGKRNGVGKLTTTQPLGAAVPNPGKLSPPLPTGSAQTAGRVGTRKRSGFDEYADAEVAALGEEAAEAQEVIGDFFEEAGVENGRDGMLFGLRVSHIVLAIGAGHATLGYARPLLALASVVVHDAILPLSHEVAHLREEWGVVMDRCIGFVELMASFPDDEQGTMFLKDMLFVLIELYETASQCQHGGFIAQHLQEAAYKKEVKAQLTAELIERLSSLYWKLSTDVLKMLMRSHTAVLPPMIHKKSSLPPGTTAAALRPAPSVLKLGRRRSSLEDSYAIAMSRPAVRALLPALQR